jgi:hypothetical protein
MPPDDPYEEMEGEILNDLLNNFSHKSQDYGDTFKYLGLGGQYSDIYRKVRKLKKVMWDGGYLEDENAEEILSDLFGNILISIWLLRHPDDA